MVDLLFAASGIEPEVTACATRELVLEEIVPVATVGHLIAMKLVSLDDDRRPRIGLISSSFQRPPTPPSGRAPRTRSG